MDQNVDMIKRLLLIVTLLILAAGILFLGLSIFGKGEGNSCLISAFACIILANLFHIIRMQMNRK